MQKKIIAIYENEGWFATLKKEMSKRQLTIEGHFLNETIIEIDGKSEDAIYFNRLSASSPSRNHHYSLKAGEQYVNWLEEQGRQVINGTSAMQLEQSKFRQYRALRDFEIRTPKSIFVTGGKQQLSLASEELNFPFIYKPDCGGKGLGVKKIANESDWHDFLEKLSVNPELSSTHILQEYIISADQKITRCEFIAGKFHYAIDVSTKQGFELCPAEACIPKSSCNLEAEASLFSLAHDVDHKLIQSYEALLAKVKVPVAGIEFVRDNRGVIYTYDINCNTNYAPDIEAQVETPAMQKIVEYLRYLQTGGQL